MDKVVFKSDLSEVNPQDLSGNGHNGTGTGIVAADDLVLSGIGIGTRYNGIDEKTSFGDIGLIRAISLWVNPDTDTEELVLIDTGKDIMVSGGTVTYTGITASATYIDGEPGTTLAAGTLQHLVCVLDADVDANTFQLATDGTNFGSVLLDEPIVFSDVITQIQAIDIMNRQRHGRLDGWRLTDPKFKVLDIPLNNNTVDSVTGLTATPTALTYTEGAYGKSVGVFDGADTKADVANNSNLQGLFNGGGTISALIKANGAGEINQGNVINKYNEYIIYLSVNKIRLYKYFSGTNGYWDSPNSSISYGGLYHVVVTYDSSSVTNDPVIYINGERVNVIESATPVGTSTTVADVFTIGNRKDSALSFDGQISLVKAHKMIATWDEVKVLHRMAKKGL